jgi:hypothetical protein
MNGLIYIGKGHCRHLDIEVIWCTTGACSMRDLQGIWLAKKAVRHRDRHMEATGRQYMRYMTRTARAFLELPIECNLVR